MADRFQKNIYNLPLHFVYSDTDSDIYPDKILALSINPKNTKLIIAKTQIRITLKCKK